MTSLIGHCFTINRMNFVKLLNDQRTVAGIVFNSYQECYNPTHGTHFVESGNDTSVEEIKCKMKKEYRRLLTELYQICGAMNCNSKILNNLSEGCLYHINLYYHFSQINYQNQN